MRWDSFSDAELGRFLGYQQQSFEIQRSVGAELAPGITEREVTKRLMKAYRAAGVTSYFHLPVALFGDRTALPDPWDTLQFWPTDRVLQPGDAVILDASPIFDGLLVDTSSALCCDPAPAQYPSVAIDDLGYRTAVLDAVRSGATFREIAIGVDDALRAAGYRNCHRLHPGEVLGHRVGEVADVAEPDRHGFAHQLVAWFVSEIERAGSPGHPAPTWSANATSDHPPADGLWAVEPHIGIGPIGVKWEEILVIQGSDAFWLDERPPHVARWAA